MSSVPKLSSCEDVATLLVFYTCDELTSEEREQVAAHLAVCSGCRAQLSEEDALQNAIDRMPQVSDQFDTSGVLLSQCRSELSESLDELSAPKADDGWRPFGFVRQWMALRPGWSAAALLLVGAIVGTQAFQWLPSPFNTGGTGSPVNVLAAPRISEDQLNKMEVSNVNFSRPNGRIQVQIQAEQPLTLSSDEDGADVKRVLTFVITNGDRFDAGVRLDCVEALRAAAMDDQSRSALLRAARKDQNAAVRLRALDSLRDIAANPNVRDVLLEALKNDPNPGVRVEAVNLLVRSLESADDAPEAMPEMAELAEGIGTGTLPSSGMDSEQRILRALEDLRQHDSNRYVRLRSAAALRQIASQNLQ